MAPVYPEPPHCPQAATFAPPDAACVAAGFPTVARVVLTAAAAVVATVFVIVAALVVGAAAVIFAVLGVVTSFTVAPDDEALRFEGPALALTCAATWFTARGVTSLPLSAEMKDDVEPPANLPLLESTLFSRHARPSALEHAEPPETTKVDTFAALSVEGCATLLKTLPSIRAWAPV